eukprot:4651574-Alexandrium_andersonii.AAC.1
MGGKRPAMKPCKHALRDPDGERRPIKGVPLRVARLALAQPVSRQRRHVLGDAQGGRAFHH